MNAEDFPHLTVATVIERERRFLLVEEEVDGVLLFNQPAGHVEPGESLGAAAKRETLEETGWQVELLSLLGCAHYQAPSSGISYCRVSFAAKPVRRIDEYRIDPDIHACHWFELREIESLSDRMRSPLVLRTLQRYLQGRRYGLDFFY